MFCSGNDFNPRKRETRDLRIEAPSSKRVQREGGSSSLWSIVVGICGICYLVICMIEVAASKVGKALKNSVNK